MLQPHAELERFSVIGALTDEMLRHRIAELEKRPPTTANLEQIDVLRSMLTKPEGDTDARQ